MDLPWNVLWSIILLNLAHTYQSSKSYCHFMTIPSARRKFFPNRQLAMTSFRRWRHRCLHQFCILSFPLLKQIALMKRLSVPVLRLARFQPASRSSFTNFRRHSSQPIMAGTVDTVKNTIAENFDGISHSLKKPEHQFSLSKVPDQSGKVAVITGGCEMLDMAAATCSCPTTLPNSSSSPL